MPVIQNGIVFLPDGTLKKKNVIIENGKVKALTEDMHPWPEDVIDASECIVSPGFVDIHIHGAAGSDFSDGERKHIDNIAGYLIKQGVTAFLGTTMSLEEKQLTQIMETAAPLIGKTREGMAALWGINLEGPFIALSKKGGQNGDHIRKPDFEMFTRLNERSGGAIRLVDIAPELEGSLEFIRNTSKNCRVSLAHTEADYDMAKEAFAQGASHITHLYNAMPPINHRKPGIITAAAEDAAYVELICDGRHIHPAVVRLTFRMFGRDRICLVSDSMRACGLAEGEYELGGQAVYVKGDLAALKDGTLAGSTVNVAEGVRRAIRFGVLPEEALQAATLNPARAAGLERQLGSLKPGNRADIVLLDKGLYTRSVFLEGQLQKI